MRMRIYEVDGVISSPSVGITQSSAISVYPRQIIPMGSPMVGSLTKPPMNSYGNMYPPPHMLGTHVPRTGMYYDRSSQFNRELTDRVLDYVIDAVSNRYKVSKSNDGFRIIVSDKKSDNKINITLDNFSCRTGGDMQFKISAQICKSGLVPKSISTDYIEMSDYKKIKGLVKPFVKKVLNNLNNLNRS